MSRDDLPTLNRAWPILVQLIALLQVRVAQLVPASESRWQVLHLTRLAESLVRRWLMLKACATGPWPTVRAATLGSGHFRSGETSGMTDRVAPSRPAKPSRFRLVERDPALPVWVYHPATATAPGAWWLEPAAPSGGGFASANPTLFNPDRLRRRCAALSAVLEDPEAHILRMARWLARAAARRKIRSGRAHPLRIGRPPGASQRQRRRDPERQRLLYWLDTLAREAVARCGGP